MATLDYFLTLKLRQAGDVKGEATAAGFEGAIEIQSYAWGEVFGEGQGGQAGRVQMQNFHFCMSMNKASAVVMLACAQGDQVQEAVLKCCRDAGGGKQEFLKWTLKDGNIASYQTSGGTGDVLPMEMFEIRFRNIQVDYRPQTSDGSLGPP